MSSLITGKRPLSIVYLAILAGFVLLLKQRFNDNFGKNDCNMTFMWRQIMLMDVGFKDYNQYSLFLYGEGRYAHNFINNKQVDGIPIIFVPGNAGSGRQVRSLASILQNKTESRITKFHFDVFGVDFNEEFSGIHSNYLKEHANFLQNAIKHVWNMYKKPPHGIILYGHSIGGVVSQLVLADEEINDKISMVFALASPFNEPPFPIDDQMVGIWRRLHEMKSNVPIISIDGGLRDELIDPAWTYAPFVLHASSTEIDDVWLETDHQCAVWCNQLVRQNTRFLFDYAREPNKFNHVAAFNKHFKNSLQHVKPTKSNSTTISTTECNPKCPTSGVLRLDPSSENNMFVSISKIFSSQLSLDNEIVGEVHACGNDRICSFYSGSSNNHIVDLRWKDSWILKNTVNDSIHLSVLNTQSTKQHKFDFVGLKIVKLFFDHPLLIYKLNIKTNEPIQNIIFKSNKTKQLSRIDKLQHSLIVNLIGFDDSNAQLYFFGTKYTKVEILVEFDLINSIVKVLRTVRFYLISSIILFHLICSFIGIFGLSSISITVSTVAIFIASRLWFNDYILVSAIILFEILVYLSILSLNNLISPVFHSLNKRTSNLRLNGVLKLGLFVGLFISAIYTHSFPFVSIIAICILIATPQLSNLRIWIELFLFLQFPSGFEFIFGITRYHQFIYPWSSFTVSALLFIANGCIFSLIRGSKSSTFTFYAILNLLIVSWILYNRQIGSLLALDSLSFISALFIEFELCIFNKSLN